METKVKAGFTKYDLVKMSEKGYWYFATPYSKYPTGREAAFHTAVDQAALYLKHGVVVFCPIAHTHPIYERHSETLGSSWETWKKFDFVMLKNAVGLIVCKMDGWQDSVGVTEEIAYAKSLNKPIVYTEVI